MKSNRLYQYRCNHRDAFAAAEVAEALVRSRRNPYGALRNLQYVRDILFHFLDMGREFRRFRNDRRRNIAYGKSVYLQYAAHLGKPNARLSAPLYCGEESGK